MNYNTNSIIYHLTEEQSLTINKANIMLIESESSIDIYDMQLPSEVLDRIVNYSHGIHYDNFFCMQRKTTKSRIYKI